MSRFRMFLSAEQPRQVGRTPVELSRTPFSPAAPLDDLLLIECGSLAVGGELGWRQEAIPIAGPVV